MLDIKDIRKNPESYKKALQRKNVPPQKIDELLALDKEKILFLQNIEEIKRQQNEVSKKIAQIKGEEKQKVLEDMKGLSQKKKEGEKKLQAIEEKFIQSLEALPNPPHPQAPDGASEEENVILRHVGDKPSFDFEPLDHVEICDQLDLLDTQRSAKVSGSRFYYLKNELAILQRALIFWTFMEVQKKGFTPIIPPFLTRDRALYGTGYLNKDENYVINPGEDDLYLIGTSEVPMVSYFDDEILEEKDMPFKFVSYSPCFRREAGSYGKDTRGIFRVHQFEKVEMVMFCLPEQSEALHEEIRNIEEELLQKLSLPYQVVNVACGDLGNSASKKYDLEAWFPGQNQYREVTSTSICTDFQTRRLNIRIRKKDGSIVFAHTLNGTATSSRPLIALLENFQQKDGSVLIPQELQPLCGFKTISPRT